MTSDINSNSDNHSGDFGFDVKKFPIPKIKVSKDDIFENNERIAEINSKQDSS